MKSQALFDAMSAAVKSKGPELVKMGGAATCLQVDILCSAPAMPVLCPCNAPAIPGHLNAMKKIEHCVNLWYFDIPCKGQVVTCFVCCRFG